MKFRWLAVVALGVVASAVPAVSQVSAYAEFSASKLTGGISTQTTSVLYGPTFGITAQLANKPRLKFYGDVRAGLYGTSQRLDGVAVGPKIGYPIKKFEAYAEALVGFARYNDGLGNKASATTDAQIQFNFGADRRVTERLDWRVFEFGYEQYYALGGVYNPKTFSTGVVVHLGKR